MNKSNAGFLAVLGVAIVAAIGAFFFAPKLFKTDPDTASQPAPKSNMVDATVPAPDAPSAGQAEIPAETAAEPDTATDPAVAADAWVTPSFDVLRVEPDGSTVIAGKAEPGTTLDIMNGETVIASTSVGPSGDFVAILDTPLAAGDYQLTLRIVGKDGSIRQSEEVATVSVPETANGDLLAMVSKPGKASRIIAQPTAPAVEETAEGAAAVAQSGDAEAPAAVTDQAAVASAEPGSGGTDAATAAAPDADGDTAAQAKTEIAAAADSSGDAAPEIATPALPEASSLLTTQAPQLATEEGAASPSESATDSGAGDEAGEKTEVAMATPDAATAAVAIPAGANVRVDAVEIEGDRIFIAGSATPGFMVQVAADGVVIGSDKADETGRFIVEATSQLAVGDHFISADLMDKAGENVLLRATVPFNRPEGEALAAVAPAEPAAAPADPAVAAVQAGEEVSPKAGSGDAGTPAELILPDIASLSKMREEAFEALSALQKMVSGSEAPDAAAVTAALENAVGKLKSAAMADLPAGSSDEAKAIARSMRIQAEAALAVLMPPKGGDASAVAGQSAAQRSAQMIDDLVTGGLARMNETLQQAEIALSEPADMAIAAADGSTLVAEDSGQPGEPKTILQAPLASTPGAVIIRRGDTLWQISRRTYGEGVRYTTIYVANRSQIQDPDRIKPGQVFSVPESPLENAEEMHKQLLSNGKKP